MDAEAIGNVIGPILLDLKKPVHGKHETAGSHGRNCRGACTGELEEGQGLERC